MQHGMSCLNIKQLLHHLQSFFLMVKSSEIHFPPKKKKNLQEGGKLLETNCDVSKKTFVAL